MRLPFLAATGALAEGLEPTVSERVGKSPAVGGVEGVEIWLNSSRVTGRSKLALPGDSVYFHSLKTRRPGAPLPTIPDWVNDVCARKLQDALLVLLKQRSPNDKSSWKTYVQANNIMVPDHHFVAGFGCMMKDNQAV